MNRQPFAVHRISAHKLVDVVHKGRESESEIAVQLSPKSFAHKDLRVLVNKPHHDVPYEVHNKIPHSDALPRSAPLRLNKLTGKDECKELKAHEKGSYGGSSRAKFPEIQTPDRHKMSNPLKMPRISVEGSRKGSTSLRKLKETPGKQIRTDDDEKTPEIMYGFETDRANVKTGVDIGKEAYMASAHTEMTPKRVEYNGFVVSSRNSPIVESLEDDWENENKEVNEQGVVDEVKEQGEESSEEQNSTNKLTHCSRGILRRENLSAHELQKQTDQKKLMKEYLDSQLNEKKRQKEEEKQKQREFEKREEERIKNEITLMGKRHERELAQDAKKSVKPERNEIRQTVSPTLKEIPAMEAESLVAKEEKAKSGDNVESARTSAPESQKTIKESGEVEVLVEENKHLRDENIKKKEIIDILINALRQQGDQARVPLYQNQAFRKNSSSRLVTPNTNLVHIKNIDATYNQFSYQNDGSYEEKNYFIPSNGQQIYEPTKPFPSQRSEMTGNIDMSADLPQRHYMMNTPVKSTHPYRIFLPSRQELEGHNYFTEATSPKLLRSENTIFSPKANNLKGDWSKQSLKPKPGFLPVLTEPSSVKSYQKSNLLSNMDIVTNTSRNLEGSRFNSPIKKENLVQKQKEAPSMKYSFSDVTLYKSENNVRPIKDQTNMHKNLLDLLNPISISKINVPKTSTNSPDLRYPIGLTKAEESITVIDGASQAESQLRGPYPLRSLRLNENSKISSGISIIDMATQGSNSRRAAERMPEIQFDEAKPYNMMRLSQRISSDQTGNQSGRTKFPKEVFNINMKRSVKDKVQL